MIISYKYAKAKKKVGKYTTLVKTSIIMPLIDQFNLRALKYKAIKIINAKKQSTPSNTITGYSKRCFDISPNETIVNHIKAQTSPNAPTPDNTNDIAEELILQCILTVFENNKQKNDETTKLIPNKTKTNGKPSNNADSINVYVGVSAPPIIPVAPLFDV